MPSERVSLEAAQSLLSEGYTYVDVRTEAEFEAGHVPGAFNVPVRQRGPSGMMDNPEFLSVMDRRFPKDTPLIIGCQSGPRSRRAAEMLDRAGYSNVRELGVGWDGARDPFGRIDPGWGRKGLPVEAGAPEGRRYADLR